MSETGMGGPPREAWEPSCACPNHEARACAITRGGMMAFGDSLDGVEPEPCECDCHEDEQEDDEQCPECGGIGLEFDLCTWCR